MFLSHFPAWSEDIEHDVRLNLLSMLRKQPVLLDILFLLTREQPDLFQSHIKTPLFLYRSNLSLTTLSILKVT